MMLCCTMDGMKQEGIMAIVAEKEKEEMSDEQKKEYCEWCWYHDYGNCSKCALEMKVIKTKS